MRTKAIVWLLGSLALTAIGFVVIPSLLDKYGAKLYKLSSDSSTIDFDNLGPEIVRRNA